MAKGTLEHKSSCVFPTLVARREDDVDRDYWDRVNQGDSVRGAASMFERSLSQEEDRKQPPRFTKLKLNKSQIKK